MQRLDERLASTARDHVTVRHHEAIEVPVQDVRAKLEIKKAESTLQLLFKAARLLNERAIGRVRARTGKPLRVSHTALLPHLDLEGTRLTVLAERLGVSKQAAGQLVDELEEMGFVERAPDPADARAKLVRFSKRGQKSLFDGLAVLGELELELRAAAGAAQFRVLREVLAAVVAAEERRRQDEPSLFSAT